MTIEIEKRVEALEERLAEASETIAHLHALIAPVSKAAGETMRAARSTNPFAQARVERRNAAIDLEVAAFTLPERLEARRRALHAAEQSVRTLEAAAAAEEAEVERIGLGVASGRPPRTSLLSCLESRAWCTAVVEAHEAAAAEVARYVANPKNTHPGPIVVVIGDAGLMRRGGAFALPRTEDAPRGVVWTGATAAPVDWIPGRYETHAERHQWAELAAGEPCAEGCIRVAFDGGGGGKRFDVVDLAHSTAHLEPHAKIALVCDTAQARDLRAEVEALEAQSRAGGL